MNRWLALLIAIVVGGIAAFIATTFITMSLFGVVWIFVFGDDPWPGWVEPALNVLAAVVAIALWAALAWLIWCRLSGARR